MADELSPGRNRGKENEVKRKETVFRLRTQAACLQTLWLPVLHQMLSCFSHRNRRAG
jgi:hypothetical protein